MSDKELLELAAKAARMTLTLGGYLEAVREDENGRVWNPLIDDGDAFRLMVKLNLNLSVDCAFDNVQSRMVYVENNVGYDPNYRFVRQDGVTDPLTAARRVIVELAAKLGKETK